MTTFTEQMGNRGKAEMLSYLLSIDHLRLYINLSLRSASLMPSSAEHVGNNHRKTKTRKEENKVKKNPQ